MSALSDLIGVLVPGGLAAGGLLIFQAIKSWREGSTSREETVLQRWQRLAQEDREARAEAEADEEFQTALKDYWRSCYADLEFRARQAGIDIPTRPPLPERMRVVRSATSRRKKSVRQTQDGL